MNAEKFIETWKDRDGNEMGNSQSFLNDLCDLLEVPRPHDPNEGGTREEYSFERPVTFKHNNGKTSSGRIDLYRRGSFVLEAKQGSDRKARISDPRQHELLTGAPLTRQATGMAVRGTPKWTAEMLKAKSQAYSYARALDIDEGWPPFLIVVDIGNVIDIYADFSGAGKNYTPFPDGTRYRLCIEKLLEEETRLLLRAIWMKPKSLDPTRKSARVTRKISDELAALGRSFHEQGYDAEATARFLMRCLFTMFAEDVELIPRDSFTNLLRDLRGQPENVAPMLKALWEGMNQGGFSPVLRKDLLKFNGGLFADSDALPVNVMQLGCLIRAAEQDWREVEPAIFGTLLERALSARDRHKLGAHFTPRAYVERLVTPTVLEPLRDDWMDVQAAALTLQDEEKLDDAIDLVRQYLAGLCNVRVLDPACGSGNFLYVALEGMKRLEGEVIAFLNGLGDKQTVSVTVDPHQFLGIEKNPWAAAVAELVLWIGYLQWHFRTFGKATPSEPVLRDFKNIKQSDALLTLEGERFAVNDRGQPVTIWDGETYTSHPATGKRVPDLEARVNVLEFDTSKVSDWPKADFIVGNPPFLGNKRMREGLSSNYIDALHKHFPKNLRASDFVMYWWHRAAALLQSGEIRRFGFITTDSIRQISNRKVVASFCAHKRNPISLVYAVQEHPWVDSKDGAAVEISMTVGAKGRSDGRLLTLYSASPIDPETGEKRIELREEKGRIHPDLRTGVDVTHAKALKANSNICYMGVIPVHVDGFIASESEFRSLGYDAPSPPEIRYYLGGSDLKNGAAPRLIIDLNHLSQEQAEEMHPRLLQKLLDEVKPKRDASPQHSADNRKYAEEWWKYGKSRPEMRRALHGLERFIATVETTKHRAFVFLDSTVLPDQKIRVICSDDAYILAVLNSRVHRVWADTTGGELGPTPVYNNSLCFDPFPFPNCNRKQRESLAHLGERLDSHIKRQQNAHPKLTLTAMYNVLEKALKGDAIRGPDKQTYDQAVVPILRELHDRIDTELAAAYGWAKDLTNEEILDRLVSLNKERSSEEAKGHISWLRPEFQNPSGAVVSTPGSQTLDLVDAESIQEKYEWPKAMPLQVSFVRSALSEIGEGDTESVAKHFRRAPRKTVRDILESLAALGHVRQLGEDRFAA